MINTQALSAAIDSVKKRIEGRNLARIIGAFVVTAIIFLPLLMFIEPPVNGKFASGTGALLITWLAIAGLSGHVVAGALFACKSEELVLILEMASSIVAISNELGAEKVERGDMKEVTNHPAEETETAEKAT